MTPITIAREATPTRRGFALFAYGFRPFFLLAGLHASFAVLLWVVIYHHGGGATLAVSPPVWHAHEMAFGFTTAVIAGFLLTTTANWTRTPHLRGPLLIALSAAWLAGRLAFLFGADLPPVIVAVTDLTFLPLLALAIGVPLVRAGQRRQYVFVVVLTALFLANLSTHLATFGIAEVDERLGPRFAVYVAAALIAVMGGRIIPSFTTNALRHHGATEVPTARPWIEHLAAPAIAVAALVDLVAEGSAWAGLAALAAALVHGMRLAGWRSLSTGFSPILWILHAGYAWLVIGFALSGLAAFVDAIPPTAAFHALTAGAIGVLTLGVMSRVALGHTGRDIVAAKPTVVAYVLVNLAALVRVLGPMLAPDLAIVATVVAGFLWTAAFATFTAVYAPILIAPRADGRPG
jgi:uncharacterized protein involved in response to NO